MASARKALHIILLLLLCVYFTDAAAMLKTTPPCIPDQGLSLLQLKRSFINDNLSSWKAETDCCNWEGVICDGSGRVISLDLSEFNLMSRRLDPALFNLTSLRNLNLAFIDFGQTRLPASGFERLTDIVHLNFSNTNFIGQIPMGIARLKNLNTLDFSYKNSYQFPMDIASVTAKLRKLRPLDFSNHHFYQFYLQVPSFQNLLANMSNLRELYLDSVDLSSSGSTWSTVLADSVPQLQILSLFGCGISGSIHPSFSRLGSLKAINLGNNPGLTGKVPEYFSELSSLDSLEISGTSFEGQFPTNIFQQKSLRTLDLSGNFMLSVRLTYFPDGNNLQTLNLAYTNFTYDTPLSFGNLESLKTLSLTETTMAKELPTSINLPSLNDLILWGSNLRKPALSWVGNLKELTYLSLMAYDFSHSVPTWIGNLTQLETLFLWSCKFSSPIPYQIGTLANLTSLTLASGDVFGQKIPSWIGNLTKLTHLDFSSCNFCGSIPSTIGNLTELEELELVTNWLTGKIPKSLFSLPALEVVSLGSGPGLSGSLEGISDPLFSPLSIINLDGNQLTGPIPKSFFQLTNLQYLILDSNKLTGTIELSSIWGLKSLTKLSLSGNMISIIDKEGDTVFPTLSNLSYVYLSSCNLKKFPAAFRYLDTLFELDLSNNQMKGDIPSWVWENWKDHLQSLDLSHNMLTAFEKPPSLVHMTSLAFLDLSFNRLQGNIPIAVTSSEHLGLDCSNNNFSSIVPNFSRYLTNATYINFYNNTLSGHIPPSLCSLNYLKIVDLSYNNFSGPVPSCLIERGNLIVLKLRENKLHGVLPDNIREGCYLQTIDLSGNRIEGTLPRSLENCQDLELLDVGNNHIVGSFPSWMGSLPKLRVLVLRSNQLNGTIRDLSSVHQSTKHFPSLQIIDLASNHFSNELLSEWFENLKSMMNDSNDWGQILEHDTYSRGGTYQDTVTITYKHSALVIEKILTTFKVIDFSDNSFDGPICNTPGVNELD